MNVKRWLASPAVAFLVIGALLFGLQALLSERGAGGDSSRIEVTETEIGLLTDYFTRQWNRPPTEDQLRGLVDDHVRREVLYREALALGLDRGDEVIRRRMVQKFEFLTEDLAGQLQPPDAALQTYLEENRERYRYPELRSFTHVYFNVDERGDAVFAEAESVLADLRASPDAAAKASELGDPFMLARHYRAVSPQEASRLFGGRFADALFELEPGDWQGPVASGYGLHLVLVTDVEGSSMPELDDVIGPVLTDYQREVRERAQEEILASLMERYVVEIDEASILSRSLQR
ncbi:MAG: peptidylprolyl isomerase [Gemmatimonadota bacterium]